MGPGAPWRRDNNADETALEFLIQVCGVPIQRMDQPGSLLAVQCVYPTSVRLLVAQSSRHSSLAKDHNCAPSGDNTATATPTPKIPSRNPEPLAAAAANHLAHVSVLASLGARLA